MPEKPIIVALPDGKTAQFPAGTSTDAMQKALESLKLPEASPAQQPETQGMLTGGGNLPFPISAIPTPIQAGAMAREKALAQQAAPVAAGMAVGGPVGGAVGGGVLGGALGGAAGGAATSITSQAVQGQNPVSGQSLKQTGESALAGGVVGGALGFFDRILGSIMNSKLSRGMVNLSAGTTARDVTYGNPAVAIMDNGITSPFTGDLEAYKNALRTGATPDDALVAAGGRVGQVTQKIQQIAPQVDQALSKSTVPIKVADVIDKPLEDAMADITGNRAMTAAEKDAAVTQLGALQQSLKEGLGDTITPLQANQIKQAIGARVNWAGNIAVTDEVKPAYRAVYGSLKTAVNRAVPEVASINENLSNLLSAQTDLQKLMQAEEAGQGRGALGSAVTGIARRAEAVAGRGIPIANEIQQIANRAIPAVSGPIGAAAGTFNGGASIADILRSKGQAPPQVAPNAPGLPFHLGAGL